jgi:hypothetical protein
MAQLELAAIDQALSGEVYSNAQLRVIRMLYAGSAGIPARHERSPEREPQA